MFLRRFKNVALGVIICGLLKTSLNVFSYIICKNVILFSDVLENFLTATKESHMVTFFEKSQ